MQRSWIDLTEALKIFNLPKDVKVQLDLTALQEMIRKSRKRKGHSCFDGALWVKDLTRGRPGEAPREPGADPAAQQKKVDDAVPPV